MLITFVDNQHIIPISQKVVHITPCTTKKRCNHHYYCTAILSSIKKSKYQKKKKQWNNLQKMWNKNVKPIATAEILCYFIYINIFWSINFLIFCNSSHYAGEEWWGGRGYQNMHQFFVARLLTVSKFLFSIYCRCIISL